MKFFVTVAKSWALLGFTQRQSIQKHPFNRRNLLALFVLMFCSILNGLYFFYEAETFNELTLSAYTTITHIVAVITLFISVLQMRPFLNFMFQTEEILNKSQRISIVVEILFYRYLQRKNGFLLISRIGTAKRRCYLQGH